MLHLKKGDKHDIFNTTAKGETVLEGRATLIKGDDLQEGFGEYEYWLVRFDDGQECWRWVHL